MILYSDRLPGSAGIQDFNINIIHSLHYVQGVVDYLQELALFNVMLKPGFFSTFTTILGAPIWESNPCVLNSVV